MGNGVKGVAATSSVSGAIVAIAWVLIEILGAGSAGGQQVHRIAANSAAINALVKTVQRHEEALSQKTNVLASHQAQLTKCQETMTAVLDRLGEIPQLREDTKRLDRRVHAVLGWIDEQRTRGIRYEMHSVDSDSDSE